MSFILDALKKSEQERQQKNGISQPQQKRTIALSSQASRSQFYVILLGGGILLLVVGLLFKGLIATFETEISPEQSIRVDEAFNQGTKNESVPVKTELSSEGNEQYMPAEPAPVPRYFTQKPPKTNAKPLAQHQRSTLMVQDDDSLHNERHVVLSQSQRPESQYPHYEDLSVGVRVRMPLLVMSMHFYTEIPDKRLTRINNKLYHEGDWISDDLQIIEITPSGVVLDFAGLTFELLGLSR